MSHLLTAASASLSGSPAHCFSFGWLEIGVEGCWVAWLYGVPIPRHCGSLRGRAQAGRP